jgi:hypothetical protein
MGFLPRSKKLKIQTMNLRGMTVWQLDLACSHLQLLLILNHRMRTGMAAS